MKKVVFGLRYEFGRYVADDIVVEWLAKNKNWKITKDPNDRTADIFDTGIRYPGERPYEFLKGKEELMTNKDLIECVEWLRSREKQTSVVLDDFTTLEVVEFPDDVFEFIDKIVTQIHTYLEKNDCVNDEGFTFDRLMALIKEKYYQKGYK